MEDNQKSFIINKGLSLGLILTLFPIFDLMFGISIGWTSYFIIFGLIWIILYTFLIIRYTKSFFQNVEFFSFRDAFRSLFVISALAFLILTFSKFLLWQIAFPEKYIDINQSRSLSIFETQKSVIDNSYKEGALDDEDYEEAITTINEYKTQMSNEWDYIRSEGLPLTYFFGKLVTLLFFIAIYCAILALFIRRKAPLIRMN